MDWDKDILDEMPYYSVGVEVGGYTKIHDTDLTDHGKYVTRDVYFNFDNRYYEMQEIGYKFGYNDYDNWEMSEPKEVSVYKILTIVLQREEKLEEFFEIYLTNPDYRGEDFLVEFCDNHNLEKAFD